MKLFRAIQKVKDKKTLHGMYFFFGLFYLELGASLELWYFTRANGNKVHHIVNFSLTTIGEKDGVKIHSIGLTVLLLHMRIGILSYPKTNKE